RAWGATPMRDPHVTPKEREAAITEACELLRPLTKSGFWSVVNWNDPASNDPRDVFECAVELVIALLDSAVPTSSAAVETYDSRAQRSGRSRHWLKIKNPQAA